jgi:hypothetical protein
LRGDSTISPGHSHSGHRPDKARKEKRVAGTVSRRLDCAENGKDEEGENKKKRESGWKNKQGWIRVSRTRCEKGKKEFDPLKGVARLSRMQSRR